MLFKKRRSTMKARAQAFFRGSHSAAKSTSVQENSEPTKKRRRWMLPAAIYAGNFFAAMGFSLLSPFFPKQAEEKGATPTEYGLIFSSFYFTIFLIAPVYGKLIGLMSPRVMMVGGFWATCISVVAFGFVNLVPGRYAFIATALMIRVLEGLGVAAYVTASSTIVMTEFPDKVGTVMSSLKAAFSVGVIVGPSIGGVLFDVGGYFLPFVVCGTLGFLCMTASMFVIPDSAEKRTESTRSVKDFWRGPMVYLFGAAIFGSYLCVGFDQATLEPHLRQFGLSSSLLGLLFMTQGITNCVAVPIWGMLCDKKVNTTLLSAIGSIFICIYFTFIGPAPFLPIPTKLWLVIVSLACFGVGIGGASVCAFIATLQYTLSRGFDSGIATNGLVSSMFTLCQSMGAFTGPALGGVMVQHIGYTWATLVLLSLQVILATLLMAVYIRRNCCGPKPGPEYLEDVVDDGRGEDIITHQQKLTRSYSCDTQEAEAAKV